MGGATPLRSPGGYGRSDESWRLFVCLFSSRCRGTEGSERTARGPHPIPGYPPHPGGLRHPRARLSPRCARGDTAVGIQTPSPPLGRSQSPGHGVPAPGTGEGSAPLRPRPTQRAARPAPAPTRAGVWGDQRCHGWGDPWGCRGGCLETPTPPSRDNPSATPRAGSLGSSAVRAGGFGGAGGGSRR